MVSPHTDTPHGDWPQVLVVCRAPPALMATVPGECVLAAALGAPLLQQQLQQHQQQEEQQLHMQQQQQQEEWLLHMQQQHPQQHQQQPMQAKQQSCGVQGPPSCAACDGCSNQSGAAAGSSTRGYAIRSVR